MEGLDGYVTHHASLRPPSPMHFWWLGHVKSMQRQTQYDVDASSSNRRIPSIHNCTDTPTVLFGLVWWVQCREVGSGNDMRCETYEDQ